MLDNNTFNSLVSVSLDKLGGGYYHPDMLQDGRIKDQRYASSGETMFDIDRKNGGSINTSAAGLQFWKLIDQAKARSLWKWNYKGGSLEPVLKGLVAKMIRPIYDYLSKTYLSSESKNIVESDKRLLFHFVYACFNGAGFFQRFATEFNTYVSSGIKNINKLVELVVNRRLNSTNSLIAQGGGIIKSFIYKLETPIQSDIIMVAAFSLGLYLIFS